MSQHKGYEQGDIRWAGWLREKGRGEISQVRSLLLTKLTFVDKKNKGYQHKVVLEKGTYM